MTISRRTIYSGRVQGVGFRYTAQRVAGGFPINGFVRNLPDGTVELVAEGTEKDVAGFLAVVAQQMDGCIAAAQQSDQPPAGYQGFHIRH